MNENELYSLLEETAGMKKLSKHQEEATHNLSRIEKDLHEVKAIV